MDLVVSFVFLIVGLTIGAVVMYFMQKSRQLPQKRMVEDALQIQRAELTKEYEIQLSKLREQWGAAKAALQTQRAELTKEHEIQLYGLRSQQSEDIKNARKDSLNRSRSVLKGKVAEQIAPLLPGFKYLPSDARFIGNPIDYIIFDGYTAVKDDGASGDNLEVVIADIKQGKSGLSSSQRAIARAIEAGRVRFEVIRVQDDGTVKSHTWRSRSSRKTLG